MQSGGIYPAPRNSVGTHNAEQPGGKASSSGGVWGSSIIAMGVTANAATDTERARWVSNWACSWVILDGIPHKSLTKGGNVGHVACEAKSSFFRHLWIANGSQPLFRWQKGLVVVAQV